MLFMPMPSHPPRAYSGAIEASLNLTALNQSGPNLRNPVTWLEKKLRRWNPPLVVTTDFHQALKFFQPSRMMF